MTAADIVGALGSQVARTMGSLERSVEKPAPLGDAEPNSVSFCVASGDEGLQAIAGSRAGTVICPAIDGVDQLADEKTLIVVAEPRLAFARVLERLFRRSSESGIHPSAAVSSAARLGSDVTIGALSYVGETEIGHGTVIHPHVTIHDGTRIGRNVIVWSGTVIGLDGFGFHRNERGTLERFPHTGGVTIEDDVEIGANTIVARGALTDTLIRRGAKIDCFVHVAHNVVVGEHAVIVAHAMLGGSAHIGDRAWIAPCACIRDGIQVGAEATVGLGAVVVKDVAAGATVMGAPARDAAEFRRMLEGLKALTTQP